MRIELTTSSLPRKCSTTEPQRPFPSSNWSGRPGSNWPPIAWKAIALPNELLPQFKSFKELFFHQPFVHAVRPASYKKIGGQSRVRTYVLVREQIYSLSPLTTRPSAPNLTEPEMGLEPATCWLQISCSTNWAIPARHKRTIPIFGMAKVMEFFIYQNFRAVFILKIKVKIKISSNSCLQIEKTWK